MHIERLTKIAEWLEAGAPHKNGHGFNMSYWHDSGEPDHAGHDCGTAMCIGGAAEQFFGDVDGARRMESDSADKILGLTEAVAEDLFFPHTYAEAKDGNYSAITPAHAARVIRKLIATGEVDWFGTEAGE